MKKAKPKDGAAAAAGVTAGLQGSQDLLQTQYCKCGNISGSGIKVTTESGVKLKFCPIDVSCRLLTTSRCHFPFHLFPCSYRVE